MTDRAKQLERILKSAGEKLLKQSVTVNCHKTKNDLLTENDILMDEYIVGEITALDPDASIISEEKHSDGELSERCYVIDPIDGTCNFAAGLPLFGIQVAYFEHGEPVLSVLHYPASGDVLLAKKGEGAYWNGKRIVCNGAVDAGDGILIISDYYDDVPTPMCKQFALVKDLQPHFLKTRHFGAACVDFSMLARGNAVAYISYYSKIWDIAPGYLAAKEAGCVCASVNGDEYRFGSAGLVVANNNENLQLILRHFARLS